MSVRTLSQSFKVDDRKGGIFVTKLDLFFFEKSDTFPVTIQIREMNNGIPSSVVLPFSEVTLFPSQVNVSNDGTAPTTIYFDAPVYLENDTFYCFTVIPGANSAKYKLWVAKAGDRQRLLEDQELDIQASKQPLVGTMFLSDDNYSYAEVLDSDLKFILHMALFDEADGSFRVRNAPIDDINFISHGADRVQVGDLLTVATDENKLAVVTEARYGELENRLRYRVVGSNTFSVGDYLLGTRNNANVEIQSINDYKNDTYYYNFGVINVPGTQTSVSVKGTEFNGANYVRDTDYETSIINETNRPFRTKNVLSYSNVNIPGQSSKITEELQFTFKGDLENISPLLDIDKMVGYLTDNKVNIINPEDEEVPVGGPAEARYITRKVNLDPELPAQDIIVYLTAHRPKGSDIYVYYKIHSAEDEEIFDEKKWNLMELSTNVNSFSQDRNDSSVYEYKYIVPISDRSGNSEFDPVIYTNSDGAQFVGFNTLAIKIVMSSDNQLYPPNVKDLRVIATT